METSILNTNLFLVVLKIFVSTNVYRPPGDVYDPSLYHFEPMTRTLEYRPPKPTAVTNYVLGFKQGTNAIELLTVKKSQTERGFNLFDSLIK